MTLGSVSFAAEDGATASHNSYEVLSLPPTATQSDIQRAYKQLAARYHPDRMKGSTAHFRALTAAYELIANPVNRAIYDMECGLVEASAEHLQHIHRLRRVEAMQALRLMFGKCHDVTQHEMSSESGLLILQAQYGQLDSPQHVLDVTMQLQTRVQDGMLVVAGGGSKSWLEGFYDPTEGGANALEVVYKVDGVMHRTLIADEEELLLPHPNHRMSDAAVRQWERRYTLRAVDLSEQAVKRRRRYIAAGSLVTAVAVGAVVYYRHRGSKAGAAVNSGAGGEVKEQGWVSGLGGVVGRGSEQVREVVAQWLALLSQWTALCVQQLPAAVRDNRVVQQLGSGLVASNSLQWLGERMPLLRLPTTPAI